LHSGICLLANVSQSSSDQPASTRPRLQSVNQDFSDLSEQIRQVAHIIRLPDDWAKVEDDHSRSTSLQHVVRARAEWVLRWLLDKLKHESQAGAEARAMPTTWQLLECIMFILPVSRSAPHLRDASFTSILERTLVENFDRHLNSPCILPDGHVHSPTASESSETVCDDTQPSRKRKRGSPDVSPSKRAALASSDPMLLFSAVHALLRNMTGTATADTAAYDTTQTELKKMALRAESAQASRILKFWLVAVQKLVATMPAQDTNSPTLATLVDLSVVFEIWELRIASATDSTGSSSENFASECLVPTLQLADHLKTMRAIMTGRQTSRALDLNLQALDKLLTRHLLAPARSAFFTEAHTDTNEGPIHRGTFALSASLGPLRAILVQIEQIEDAGEAVPPHLAFSPNAIGYLLDLAVRASPSRTPKARLGERPWIQAVFLSMAECVGCRLGVPPDFVTSKSAVAALQSSLYVLRSHDVTIDSAILRDLFWYHCGVKYPQQGVRKVHWTLVAALIELDSSIFATESRALASGSKEQKTDLTEFLFDQISNTEFTGAGFRDAKSTFEPGITYAGADRVDITQPESREMILEHIVTPIVSAFSRNRNMLGFMRRWDDQLVKSYKFENRKALKEKTEPIWEDRTVTKALSEFLEQSLTQGQIATLVEEHVARLEDLSGALAIQASEDVRVRKLAAFKKASSSAVIIPAILESTQSEDILATLRPQLHSLFVSYAKWVQDARFSAYTRLSLSWFTLCLLLHKLWPLEIHASLQMQQEILHPLVEQALKDISTSRQESGARKVDSSARAAAMMFCLIACEQLQTVSGSEELVQKILHKVMMSFSASQLEVSELLKTVEQFCANFIQLLSHLDPEPARESILAMLKRLSTFDYEIQDHISGSLAQAVFRHGSSALHAAYASALSDALGEEADARLHRVALQDLLCVQASALSRERREAILDRLSALLTTGSVMTVNMLGAMAQLMVVPNASARISTDGGVVFDIALQLQKQGVASPVMLQQLQLLSKRILCHIIPNQSQAQSRALLGEYQKRLNTLIKGTKKVSSTGLAILRATILEQKDSQLLSMKQYVALLKQCLSDDGTDGDDTAPFEDVLDAFEELSTALLGDPASLKATTSWLRTWIKDNADLESYIISSQPGSIEVAEYVARLHKLVARYRLYPDARWLVALSVKMLRGPLADEQKEKVLATVNEVLTPLETTEKMSLVPLLVEVDDPSAQAASYTVLQVLVSTLPDKVSTDAVLKQKQLATLPRLCGLLIDTASTACFNALTDSINTFLNHKAALTTQHSVECVLGALVKFTSRTSPNLPSQHASHIFTRLCETGRLVLLVHRSKTGGRSHILLPLLQGLLFCLFTPTSVRSGALPLWLRSGTSQSVCLTPTDAAHYTRLLSTLCNPPQSSISKAHQQSRKSKDLNDPVKAARERTSHFLYPLLASLCRFQLSGRLLPALRAKLMPGVWEVMSTASLHKEELEAMFAGLSRSEKDVWRSAWAEWDSVHGRKERFIGAEDV
jgi:nucleolar pre-ribosomal-associated protein 2